MLTKEIPRGSSQNLASEKNDCGDPASWGEALGVVGTQARSGFGGKMYTRVFGSCPLTLLPLPPATVRIKSRIIIIRIEVAVVAVSGPVLAYFARTYCFQLPQQSYGIGLIASFSRPGN